MVGRHKLLLPSNTIYILETGNNVSELSPESLDSLSAAVNLEGTGEQFRSPPLYQLVIASLATSIRSFTDVRFHGLSRIPRKGPVIVVSNHISNLDPIFMVQATRRPIHFLSKKENFESPRNRFRVPFSTLDALLSTHFGSSESSTSLGPSKVDRS